MTKAKTRGGTVGLRTKPYSKARLTGRKLVDHPAMKELSRMIADGEVNRQRTISYLTDKRQPQGQGGEQ